jgi:hypothetical protein
MSRGRVGRILAIGAVLVLVAGCSRNPQFQMTNANRAYTAFADLYVLLAKAEIGALRSPSSFNGTVDSYAEVIGGFEIGRLLGGDRPAATAALQAPIDLCLDQLRAMATIHKASGVAPDAPIVQAVRRQCDTAVQAVAENEVSSWLFETAAGDL